MFIRPLAKLNTVVSGIYDVVVLERSERNEIS